MANKSVSQSSSEKHRNEGNIFYRDSQAEGIAACLKKDRLKNALACYHRAESASLTQHELSSAAKNIGQASQKMSEMLEDETKVLRNTKVFYLKDALKYYSKANDEGKLCKTSDWLGDLMQKIYNCLQDALTLSGKMEEKEKLDFMDGFCSMIPIEEFKPDWYLEIAKMLFHQGITAMQNGDYKRCLRKMHDCHFPLEEMQRYSQDVAHIQELEILQEDVTMNLHVAEGMQAKETGDELLKNLLQDEEEVNFDLVWDVIDWYKKCILLCSGVDLEVECMALSNMGMVYDNILKDKVRAKECFKKALELSQALFPRTFTHKDWYMQCTVLLERYQQEFQEAEDKVKEEERQTRLKKIKEELIKLKANNTDANSLLTYIYKTHPPKNRKHKLNLVIGTKKALRKAIIHYHPDKQSEETHGIEWVTLAEEITKLLSGRYECFKIDPDEDL